MSTFVLSWNEPATQPENVFVKAVRRYLEPFYAELEERAELYNATEAVRSIYEPSIKAVLKYIFFQHVVDDCTNGALSIDPNYLTRESRHLLNVFRNRVMEIIDHAYIDGERRFGQLYPDTDPETFLTQCHCRVELLVARLA